VQNHTSPFVLPGGRAVLFTIAAGNPQSSQIAALDLKTRIQKTLIQGGGQPAFFDGLAGTARTPSPSAQAGYLVYAAAGALRTARFNPSQLEVADDPVPLGPVMTFVTGHAEFAVSRNGALVTIPGSSSGDIGLRRSLVWVDRQGREEPIKAPERGYASARLSPDGNRVALGIYDFGTSDIWVYTFATGALDKLTKDLAPDMSPIWTRDGRRIVWGGVGSGATPNIFWQAADGAGTADRLTTSPNAQFPSSFSKDGARLVFWEAINASSNFDVSTLDLAHVAGSKTQAEPLIHNAAWAESNPDVSPDGNWVAYQSSESGKFEVYVRPFPNVEDDRTLISTAGGTRPAWALSGRELFYIDADGHLTAVPIQIAGRTLTPGKPVKLLNAHYFAGATTRGPDLRGYDIGGDGRFLMIKDSPAGDSAGNTKTTSLVVTLNWSQELKARVGK